MQFDQLLSRAAKHTASSLSISAASGAWKSVSFPELVADVATLCDRLAASGLRRGHQVGIKAANCYEWVVWDMAVTSLDAIVVAIPEELPATSASRMVIEHGLALLAHSADGVIEDHPSAIRLPWSGAAVPLAQTAVVLDRHDLLSKSFSSGTTGKLKGLLISRSGTELLVSRFLTDFGVGATDRHLIFLPLSNFQQRMSVAGCLWAGASLSFCHFTQVFQALKSFEPTYLIAPPILYENLNRIYHPSKDSGSALKKGLGGRTRFLITGMAPIRASVVEAFNRVGIELLEVYGATETGMIAWNRPGDNRVSTVGKRIWPDDVRIAPDGEVIIQRQHPLSLGYFQDPDGDGDAVFRHDGTIATGDIGTLDADGRLRLLGRKKDIIVTAGGKKFHPSEIESKILALDGVRQAAILQDALDQSVTALIIVDDGQDAQLLRTIDGQVASLNTVLEPYKRFQRVVFAYEPFDLNNGCLTRNLKINRKGIYAHFEQQIRTTQ